ncbi:OLC1v1030480C1 [Oldenlandia corymbosa var. corymbosa]|uniref:OLC1v1030480C1 n=1 Tax=Oldenlandia corymbosa var. corymbosa TaxID=529605 RepID=A0AAV1CHR5_OLDCO|nr:OLC1v1030480C1 [Oldenlandia corymbosa var. corymbosa]
MLLDVSAAPSTSEDLEATKIPDSLDKPGIGAVQKVKPFFRPGFLKNDSVVIQNDIDVKEEMLLDASAAPSSSEDLEATKVPDSLDKPRNGSVQKDVARKSEKEPKVKPPVLPDLLEMNSAAMENHLGMTEKLHHDSSIKHPQNRCTMIGSEVLTDSGGGYGRTCIAEFRESENSGTVLFVEMPFSLELPMNSPIDWHLEPGNLSIKIDKLLVCVENLTSGCRKIDRSSGRLYQGFNILPDILDNHVPYGVHHDNIPAALAMVGYGPEMMLVVALFLF